MSEFLTYYCVLCKTDVLKQYYKEHRNMHLENPFVSYPKTLEEFVEFQNADLIQLEE